MINPEGNIKMVQFMSIVLALRVIEKVLLNRFNDTSFKTGVLLLFLHLFLVDKLYSIIVLVPFSTQKCQYVIEIA